MLFSIILKLYTNGLLTHNFQFDGVTFAISFNIGSNACIIARLIPVDTLQRKVAAANNDPGLWIVLDDLSLYELVTTLEHQIDGRFSWL